MRDHAAVGSPEWLRLFSRRTGAPRNLARLELSEMTRPSDAYGEALRSVEDLLPRLLDRTRGPVLVKFCGTLGSGKTRAATWLLREYYAASFPIVASTCPLFLAADDLVDLRFRAIYRREEDEEEERREVLRDRLKTADLLVLDDVARVEGFRGEEHFVERTIERRIQLERSTVLTLNGVEGLSDRFRDILEEFEEVAFPGRSFRGSGR